MPNRILKDTIWDSSSLAALDDFTQDQFPRWMLLADDWGCFCGDADSIKGKVYPKRPKVTLKIVEETRLAFYQSGMLFCWQDGNRIWGFWTNFGEHNYTTSADANGTRLKPRRKTPEPPAELLAAYMDKYGPKPETTGPRAAPWDSLGLSGTDRDKTADPDLDLDLDSSLMGDPKSPESRTTFEYSPDFEEFFWSPYPKKRGKGGAYALWKKLKPSNGLRERIRDSVIAHANVAAWRKDNGQYIPDPEKFLRKRMWDDDLQISLKPGGMPDKPVFYG